MLSTHSDDYIECSRTPPVTLSVSPFLLLLASPTRQPHNQPTNQPCVQPPPQAPIHQPIQTQTLPPTQPATHPFPLPTRPGHQTTADSSQQSLHSSHRSPCSTKKTKTNGKFVETEKRIAGNLHRLLPGNFQQSNKRELKIICPCPFLLF